MCDWPELARVVQHRHGGCGAILPGASIQCLLKSELLQFQVDSFVVVVRLLNGADDSLVIFWLSWWYCIIQHARDSTEFSHRLTHFEQSFLNFLPALSVLAYLAPCSMHCSQVSSLFLPPACPFFAPPSSVLQSCSRVLDYFAVCVTMSDSLEPKSLALANMIVILMLSCFQTWLCCLFAVPPPHGASKLQSLTLLILSSI